MTARKTATANNPADFIIRTKPPRRGNSVWQISAISYFPYLHFFSLRLCKFQGAEIAKMLKVTGHSSLIEMLNDKSKWKPVNDAKKFKKVLMDKSSGIRCIS